jgi:hypothetical protein
MSNGYSVDFSAEMQDYAGRTVIEEYTPNSGEKTTRPMTLGAASLMALDTELEIDRNRNVEDKIKRALLAEYIYGAMQRKKPAPLTAEEVALLKDRLGRVLVARVVLIAVRMLDPNSAKPRAD